MRPLGQDLRYGVRLLAKTPGFTAVALLTLALGTGASTSVFSVVDAVLLKPLPYRDAERLLVICEKNPAQKKYKLFVAPANFLEWRQASRATEAMEAVQPGMHVILSGGPNGYLEPEELRLERVTAGMFSLLGVQPEVGRAFSREEDQPGRSNFAVLSHALWQRRFGGDRNIAGKSIRLRDRIYTVTGVMPPGFQVVDPEVDIWTPLALNPANAAAGASRFLLVFARLKQQMRLEQVRDEMESIGDRLEQANPALDKGWRPSVFSLAEERTGSARRPLHVLAAAVGFLLLMACANVANLLLARGGARRKELAIRTALGATRSRIITQLLAESMMLGVAGGLLGLALAKGAMWLVAHLGPASIPRLAGAQLDARVLLFAAGISILTGVLSGIAPALQVSGTNPHRALVEGGRGGTMGRPARLLRNILVIGEVGLAVVVLIGAGLLIHSFVRLSAADLGFQSQSILTFRLPLAGPPDTGPGRRIEFLRQAEQKLLALPGVRAAGGVNSLPLTGLGIGARFWVEGQPAPAPEQRPLALARSASPGYFRVLGIPLLAGRIFAEADSRQTAPVLVISRSLARRCWPGEDPVGRKLVVEDANNRTTAEVIGIVGDVKAEKVQEEDWPTIYFPYAQVPPGPLVMAVRTAGDPIELRIAAEREIHELNPGQAVADVRTMEQIVSQAVAGERFNTTLLAVFAAIAFVLAAVGVYGVISYDVTERLHEMGIRMALGAQPADVRWLVVSQGAGLAACGIALGMAGAFGVTRWMAGMLYGVKPADAYTFVVMAALLGAVALIASYLPSRQATRVDPLVALRHE